MSDLICLLPRAQFTLQAGRGQRAGEVHAGPDSLPERVRAREAQWETFLRIVSPGKFRSCAAALLVVVGGVGDVVIYELTHLHQQQRVLRVGGVAAARQAVADGASRRELPRVSGSFSRKVQRPAAVLRKQDPLFSDNM